jgi:hypothetical protein
MRKGFARASALALALLVAGMAAVSASAADTFTPPSVNLTLEPGDSATVAKTLSLDPAPAKADIVLAIDTTGSMGAAIAQAKAEANAIVSAVQGPIPGARFAVVDLEDYPGMPDGTAADVPYTLLTPFTSSAAAVSTAIGTMAADGGGDGPEAYNRTFFEAANDPALVYDPQAVKFLVVLGDAFPHSATAFGSCPARPPDDFGRDGAAGGGDDLSTTAAIGELTADNITLLTIAYNSGVLACYTSLAGATGGSAVAGGGGASLATQIVNLVLAAAASIDTVDLVVSPGCPLSISFSPAPPYGPLTAPVTISLTETIAVPSSLALGVYTCTVTAVVDGTPRATQTIRVSVSDLTAPTGRCTPTTNPAGKKVPPAGNNPRSGQNPDGFYLLSVSDNLDPSPQIFIDDMRSAAVFGPFPDGTKIKLTQAPGAKPSQRPGAGVIDWKIKLKGDAALFFVDASGNVSGPVLCRVPPPPK